MATAPISGLVAGTSEASNDLLVFVDVSDVSQAPTGTTKKIVISDFFGATGAVPVGLIQGLGAVTASTPALNSTVTWNNGAVTFTHVKATITDTASAAASMLIDLNATGTGRFYVTKQSDVNAGTITLTANTQGKEYLKGTGAANTAAADASLINLAATWNTTGAPVAIKVAVTNTASDPASLLMSLKAGAAGGTIMFQVDMSGNTQIAGTLAVTGVATLTAQPILSSLTASRAVFTDSSKGLVSNAITGTGNVVMSASPTLTGTLAAAALTLSGDLAIATNKFTVASASGNTVVAGTLMVQGTSDSTFNGTVDVILAATPATAYNHLYLDSGGGGKTYLNWYCQTGITTAKTIAVVTSFTGSWLTVVGSDGSGNSFIDLVLSGLTSPPTVVASQTTAGTPAARTYTNSSGNLQLAMGSGTYRTTTTSINITAP